VGQAFHGYAVDCEDDVADDNFIKRRASLNNIRNNYSRVSVPTTRVVHSATDSYTKTKPDLPLENVHMLL
jgi:hypothetical protein